MFKEVKEQLEQQIDFSHMSQERKKIAIEELSQLVHRQVLVRIIESLPKRDANRIAEAVRSKTYQTVLDVVTPHMKDVEQIIREEVGYISQTYNSFS